MKLLEKKILPILFVILYAVGYAQNNPGAPCGLEGFPPCEKPSSPIDMYIYILAIIALAGVAYFAKKYKAQKI